MTDCPICGYDIGACEDCAHMDAAKATQKCDEYQKLADELCAMSDAWGKAGRLRRWLLAPAIAAKVWYRMPLIFSSLIHHAEGMRAQRS